MTPWAPHSGDSRGEPPQTVEISVCSPAVKAGAAEEPQTPAGIGPGHPAPSRPGHVSRVRLALDAGSFDIVVSFAVIMHLEEACLSRVFAAIARVLRPGGVAAYSVNTARPGVDEHGNDSKGRHFTCLDAERWERYHRAAGLETVAAWDNEDITGRPGIRWVTFVCRRP